MGVMPANPLASVPRPKPRRSIPKQWSIAALSDQGDLEFVADRIFAGDRRRARHGNAFITTCRPFPGGGEVITIGTTDWVFEIGRDVAVDRVTANALGRHL